MQAGRGELVLRGLTKHYPNFVAVDGIDLAVAGGEFLTLLGPSGSGKTTTLMMVAGFTPLSGGDILLNGRSSPRSRRNGAISAWCSRTMRCFRT